MVWAVGADGGGHWHSGPPCLTRKYHSAVAERCGGLPRRTSQPVGVSTAPESMGVPEGEALPRQPGMDLSVELVPG